MVQHDVSSPRPYSRLHTLSGTKGFAQKYPEPGRITLGHSESLTPEEMKKFEELYTPEVVKHVADAAKVIGENRRMDLIMDWSLIDCLRNGCRLIWLCMTRLPGVPLLH